MSIDRDLASHTPDGGSALTVGVFDGVHLGHRHLIARLRAEARRAGLLSGVVTFRNHPASVLSPGFSAAYLTSVEERVRLLHESGVDFVVPLDFDAELARLAAGEFAGLLKERLKMAEIVAGPDFAMGRDREGDTSALATIGGRMGFGVHVVEPLTDDVGQTIRSTAIRRALARGDVEQVKGMLGRVFALDGAVSKGDGRGARMGFPTANLTTEEGRAVPGDGIYATWAQIEGRRHMAATSIGVRPTFEDAGRAVEAFVLDFDGDLYGREVRLEFVRRLRDEARFESAEALQEQMGRDVEEARAALGSE